MIGYGIVALVLALGGDVSPASTADCAEDVQRFLAAFEGSWDVRVSVRLGPDEYATTTGVSSVRGILAGCGFSEALSYAHPSGDREVHTTVSASGDGLEVARVDSEHGGFTVSAGGFDGRAVRVEWSRDMGERVLRTRYEYRVLASDRVEVEHFLSRSADDPWTTTFKAEYVRR